MMQHPQGVPDSMQGTTTFRTLQYLNNVQLDTSLHTIHFTKFQYEFNHPKPSLDTVDCYEFYFDTPQVMTDTFYVGRRLTFDSPTFPREYEGRNVPPPNIYYFWYKYIGSSGLGDVDSTTMFHNHLPNSWGFSFPIIGFHCKPLDEEEHGLVLRNITNHGLTVQWYKVEDGATYNVRVTSVDGSVDTIAVTMDSSYTFSGLPTNTRYSVQVRKQCHFATASYDTTVYSPWTSSTSFLLGDGDCLPVSNVHATVTWPTARVTWDDFHNYTAVRLRYGPSNLPQGQWTEVVVTDSSECTLTDLEPGRAYCVALQAVCGSIGDETQWSEPVTFYVPADTTGGGGTEGIEGATLLSQLTFLVPNPARDEVTVTSSFGLKAIEIWTADGVMVYHSGCAGHDATVDVSWLRAGTYIVAIHTHNGTTHKKLVVR